MSKEVVTLFKVRSVTERMDMDIKGRFSRTVEIVAETKSGIEYTVALPKADYTKEKATKLLEKEALELEGTLALRK